MYDKKCIFFKKIAVCLYVAQCQCVALGLPFVVTGAGGVRNSPHPLPPKSQIPNLKSPILNCRKGFCVAAYGRYSRSLSHTMFTVIWSMVESETRLMDFGPLVALLRVRLS